MGIAAGTLYAWQKDHDEISEAIKKGKAPVDIEVENALFKRATGYTVRVQKPVKVKTKRQLKDKGTIEEEHIELVEEEIYIAPDTTAQIYWLKNRRPDKRQAAAKRGRYRRPAHGDTQEVGRCSPAVKSSSISGETAPDAGM